MDSLLLPEAVGIDGAPEVSVTMQPKRKMSLCSCETCGGEEARYKCPRCMKYSCSLPCVKKHKVESACNGVRDKTAFVALNTFSDIHLLNDYRFLEDAGRVSDCTSRDTSLLRHTTNKFLNVLKSKARKHDIDLKILPIGFSKRRANSTFYNRKEQKFYWHLKLVFPHCQAEFTDKRVPDDRTLGEILKNYIDPTQSDPTIRQRLKEYVGSPCDVKVFMEAEKKEPGPKRYYELDISRSLRANLQKKTVVEFPTLYVTLKGFSKDMVLVDQVEKNVPFPMVLRMQPLQTAYKIIDVMSLALLSGVGPGTMQAP
ncbi:PREDICTED: box C/D snoRNA protein 1 [Nanorana parkeri]|uniref:box C/D snoRNA protein 1 n=1 Tax=Nanorana parkeri TaxID=125878 RepID=UPI0008549E22|nr:PREDICTED: box C/D snoRNA protein 1 [Nanorana parkeri]